MRIITGTARGRRLETLQGEDTRPTAERVKEGLFSALQFEIEGRDVLDLFAGSGQLGLEALSRGAASCVFVDKNPEAVEIVKRNLKQTGLQETGRVICQDASGYLSYGSEQFDIAFLDPPYDAGLLEPILPKLVSRMRPGGVIACETNERVTLPDRVGDFALARTYRYGKIYIWLYRYADIKSEEEASSL